MKPIEELMFRLMRERAWLEQHQRWVLADLRSVSSEPWIMRVSVRELLNFGRDIQQLKMQIRLLERFVELMGLYNDTSKPTTRLYLEIATIQAIIDEA